MSGRRWTGCVWSGVAPWRPWTSCFQWPSKAFGAGGAAADHGSLLEADAGAHGGVRALHLGAGGGGSAHGGARGGEGPGAEERPAAGGAAAGSGHRGTVAEAAGQGAGRSGGGHAGGGEAVPGEDGGHRRGAEDAGRGAGAPAAEAEPHRRVGAHEAASLGEQDGQQVPRGLGAGLGGSRLGAERAAEAAGDELVQPLDELRGVQPAHGAGIATGAACFAGIGSYSLPRDRGMQTYNYIYIYM